MKKLRKYCITLLTMIMIFSNVSLVLATSEPLEESTVEDIEVSDYKEEITVGEVVELTVSVVPVDSTETIIYKSGDKNIATISSEGKIQGISKGETTITISAGDFTKTLQLKVRVPAKDIITKQEYVVMAVGENFDLQVSVTPKNAEVATSFQSTDESVAALTQEGVIIGKSAGSASIIIENADVTKIVNVMVNQGASNGKTYDDGNVDAASSEIQNPLYFLEGENVVLQGADTEKLDKSLLKAIMNTEKNYLIQHENYSLTLKGRDVINTDNELKTDIQLGETKQGLVFYINDGKPLPGKVHITLTSGNRYKHLYIYNQAKECYQELEFSCDNDTFFVDTPGKYILTTEKLIGNDIPWIWLIICGIIIFVAFVVYVCVKNKHWFW